jgi:electron transfer flavoprotein-quinone oxidoreductase
MEEDFQVIVVGAGPAGATTAMLLAKAGLNVLVVERGQTAGGKNVSGGLVYTAIYNEAYPRFWEEAPVERAIVSHGLVLLGREASLSVDLRSQASTAAGLPCNAYSVLRARFDPWFAAQAETAGATLITGMTVDSLLTENGRVVGIQAGPDALRANVVVVAEGSRSILLKQAGLRDDFRADEVSLGLKEVIRLPIETINERFRCSTREGAALTFVGHTGGLQAGGFLYTNRDSVSLGIVVKISSLYESRRQPHEVLDEFKAHPGVAGLIDGGEVVEYCAQTVHRGGVHLIPRLYGNGYLVAGSAARLLLNNVVTLRGMDVAVVSGMAAARAVLEAYETGDFSSAGLAAYADHLKQTSTYRDMETFRGVYPLLENERLFDFYPNLACTVMERLFTVDGTPAKKVLRVVKDNLGGQISWWDVARDGWAVAKGLVV